VKCCCCCSQIHDAETRGMEVRPLICSTCCQGMLAVKLCSNKILQFWPDECWIVQDVLSASDPVFWWPLCAFIKYIYLLTYKMVIKQQQSMADSFLHHFHINPVYQVSALFYRSFKFCWTWVVGCWRGCLSGARCRLAHGPADATATHCLLLQYNPDWF